MLTVSQIKDMIIISVINKTWKMDSELVVLINQKGVNEAAQEKINNFISQVYSFYKKGVDIFTVKEQKKMYFDLYPDEKEFDKNWYQDDEDFFKSKRSEKILKLFYDMFGIKIVDDKQSEFFELVETEVENIVKKNIIKIISTLKRIYQWTEKNGPHTKANKQCRKYSTNFFSQDRLDKFDYLPEYFIDQYADEIWWGEWRTWEWDNRDRRYNLEFMEFFEIVANEFDPLNNYHQIEIDEEENEESEEDE